jgi:hypothetical protein
MAVAATAAPGLLRIPAQLIVLTASAKPAGRTTSALRRYIGVSGVVGVQSFMTSSRSPAGRTGSGPSAASTAGRSALRR